MTLGERITEARKRKGLNQEQLGELIDLSKSAVWKIENDDLKGGVDAPTMVKIARALDDESLLMAYLEENPVYKAVLPKVFPDLNRIRKDPAVIFTKVAHEAEEARVAALALSEVFMRPEPRQVPGFEELFAAKMEQLLDVKRAVEILEFQLLAAEVLTKESLQDIYDRQQRKCVARGYHEPERTGTEG